MDWSKKTPAKGAGTRAPMNMWTGRTKFAEPFGWGRVDPISLLGALVVAGEKGATLSFAPGNGGVGVTVRIYQGDKGDYGYAADPEQLTEMLDLLIAQWGSPSEDTKMTLRWAVSLQVPATAAD